VFYDLRIFQKAHLHYITCTAKFPHRPVVRVNLLAKMVWIIKAALNAYGYNPEIAQILHI